MLQEGFFRKGFDLEIFAFGQYEAATQAVRALASTRCNASGFRLGDLELLRKHADSSVNTSVTQAFTLWLHGDNASLVRLHFLNQALRSPVDAAL